jgi:hypothetical protein
MADLPYRVAQLLRIAWRYWMQALMADPETGPWRILAAGPWRIRDRPMADAL